ncbi:hypothetical protein HpBTM54_02050 [Helicobacter pylori]
MKLHQFRNLGKNLPTELILNSSFEKHGGLVILVGENNVGKSNILEALKAFNNEQTSNSVMRKIISKPMNLKTPF